MKAIRIAVLFGMAVAAVVMYVRFPSEQPTAKSTATDLPVRMVFHI